MPPNRSWSTILFCFVYDIPSHLIGWHLFFLNRVASLVWDVVSSPKGSFRRHEKANYATGEVFAGDLKVFRAGFKIVRILFLVSDSFNGWQLTESCRRWSSVHIFCHKLLDVLNTLQVWRHSRVHCSRSMFLHMFHVLQHVFLRVSNASNPNVSPFPPKHL